MTGLSPTIGFTSTVIAVSGTNFVNGNLRCRFGGLSVTGTFVSATRVNCAAPAQAPSTVAVEVTNNNQDYTSNSVQFIYRTGATVTSVNPLSGPSLGVTNVTVTGNNYFGGATWCKFGTNSPISAFVQTSSIMYCLAPVMSVGSVFVEASNNNFDFSTNLVPFTYYSPESVVSILPTSGPVAGGSVVTVTGTNFTASGTLVCRFGSTRVTATWSSATRLRCDSPASAAGPVQLAVSNNNQDFSTTSSTFTYYANPTVTSLAPTAGPVLGGSAVVVSGTNFVSGNLFCKFGAQVASAAFINSGSALCTSPAGSAGSIVVEISNNNQDYTTNGVTYLFQAAAAVTSLLPVTGPVVGNTTVTVRGINFVGTTIFCKFGTATQSQATIVSNTTVMCVSPPASAGVVGVEISNNNQDFTSNSVQFTYQTGANITLLVPSSGPVRGGTVVTVYGSNFVNSQTLMCSVGTQSGVQATWATSTRLTCIVPANTAGLYALEVSNNNQDYTTANVKFRYDANANITAVFRSLAPLRVAVS